MPAEANSGGNELAEVQIEGKELVEEAKLNSETVREKEQRVTEQQQGAEEEAKMKAEVTGGHSKKRKQLKLYEREDVPQINNAEDSVLTLQRPGRYPCFHFSKSSWLHSSDHIDNGFHHM